MTEEYYIGQIFDEMYPSDAADWCNNNQAYIDEIEPLNKVRRFEIKAIPQPTLEALKKLKYAENESVRDAFLLSGVTYNNILWDSDLEQKFNISVQVSQMSDEDTIEWVAMDGVTSMVCTKADLLAIGALLTQMTTYVWQYKNPAIKIAIAEAETKEELDAIEIVYDTQEHE